MVSDVEQVGLILKQRKYLIKDNKITKLSKLTFTLLMMKTSMSFMHDVNQIFTIWQTATLCLNYSKLVNILDFVPLRTRCVADSSVRKHVEVRFAFVSFVKNP